MSDVPQQQYSKDEVSQHNKDGDLWIIVEGTIFDLSKFQEEHPGGKKVLLGVAGTDATKKFLKYHSLKTIRRYGDPLRLGVIKSTEEKEEKPATTSFFGRFRRKT